MPGQHYSNDEVQMMVTLKKQGLPYREIARRVGRSQAGVRNQFFRKGMIQRTRSEVQTLYEKKTTLEEDVGTLQFRLTQLEGQHGELSRSISSLEKRREKIQRMISLDRNSLERLLLSGLITLRQKRPSLFILNQQEQLAFITKTILNKILQE